MEKSEKEILEEPIDNSIVFEIESFGEKLSVTQHAFERTKRRVFGHRPAVDTGTIVNWMQKGLKTSQEVVYRRQADYVRALISHGIREIRFYWTQEYVFVVDQENLVRTVYWVGPINESRFKKRSK